MKKAFIEKRFTRSSKLVISQANDIIDYYTEQGFNLTLRQLYYQFVARDFIPNNLKSYKRLGSIINDARLAGLIDWAAIDDRTRTPNKRQAWDTPEQIVSAVIHSYHIDRWRFASNYIEVWVEKEALVEIVEQAVEEYDIRYMACRGYVSQSAMYKAAQRFNRYYGKREMALIYLGDHDPSGMDISRDIQDRFRVFDVPCPVVRIALNMDQVRKYNPPPNPAKIVDSRAAGYIAKYGNESWELDALDPTVIIRLIQKTVKKYVDVDDFARAVALEEEGKAKIKRAVSLVSDDEGPPDDWIDEDDEGRLSDDDEDED